MIFRVQFTQKSCNIGGPGNQEIFSDPFVKSAQYPAFIRYFPCVCYQVQFGHAGSCANAEAETAVAKNQALREAGVHVPKTFDELDDLIKQVTATKISPTGDFHCTVTSKNSSKGNTAENVLVGIQD